MKAFTLSIVVACLVLAHPASSLHASWLEDGLGIGTETGDQDLQSILPDGSGGCYIVWSDRRFITPLVYMQRLDRDGEELWNPGGVRVCDVGSSQILPCVTSDGSGGFIVAWRDSRSAMRIVAQRFDADGVPQWDPDGEVVSTVAVVQSLNICTDGDGGAILAWDDGRGGGNDIYAQRINSSGLALWDGDDEPISEAINSQLNSQLVADGNGGAIITWDGPDIMAQLINANGTVQWTLDGVTVGSTLVPFRDPLIVPDGVGGAVIAWDDQRATDYDVYAQRVLPDGSMMWATDGEVICGAAGHQLLNDIVADGEWGAVITWQDARNATLGYDIYAQAVDGWGNEQWSVDGIAVCVSYGEQSGAKIAVDGDGGYFIVWEDKRSAVEFDIFAQRINWLGSREWADAGVGICTSAADQASLAIIHDGGGHLLASWEDGRNSSDKDLYAQRMDRNGYWGDPAPGIAAIRDVPGDQGGWVNLAFNASWIDTWPNDFVSRYTIWRAIDEQQALMMLEIGIDTRDAIRTQLLAGMTYYWTEVATVYSEDLIHEYAVQVETLFDSTATSSEYHYFQVMAHGSGADAVWISAPDSGYSVDNLAPCAPLALAGEQRLTPEGLELTWTPNAEPDLYCYRVYRGTDPGFEPGLPNMVAEQCDTLLFDDQWTWQTGYWYKVAAVDVHGNESEYAVFGPGMVTGDDPMPLPDATFLAQNYPNPFNPNTTIAFGLKTGGFVNLSVYDASGRLVAVLLNESRPAGQYAAVWNGKSGNGTPAASGVYFYKLVSEDFTKTRKMVLIR